MRVAIDNRVADRLLVRDSFQNIVFFPWNYRKFSIKLTWSIDTKWLYMSSYRWNQSFDQRMVLFSFSNATTFSRIYWTKPIYLWKWAVSDQLISQKIRTILWECLGGSMEELMARPSIDAVATDLEHALANCQFGMCHCNIGSSQPSKCR